MCYSNTIYSERKKEELAFCYKIGFEDVYILIFGSAFNNGSFNRLSSPFISMLYNWQFLVYTARANCRLQFGAYKNWFKVAHYTLSLSLLPDILKADKHRINEIAWMPTRVGGICWLRIRITRSVHNDALWFVASVPPFSLANFCFSLLLVRRPVGFIGESSDFY